jgi:asparagine synthase (glutamine-hydrolysing)
MCGISGELRFESSPTSADWNAISDLMERRGPDDRGFWEDGTHCTLVFRRLAILDLSKRGHQPMVDPSGRYALVFNGEIYNFRELRADLESIGESFESNGDTEVLLKALICWGISGLTRLNGIFAFAFYDRHEKTLLMARDHAGIKPLYVMNGDRGVVFGSQFNQILRHPWSKNHRIDDEAVRLYLRFSYVPAPYSILSNCSMLEPGSWVRYSASAKVESGHYWAFPEPASRSLSGNEAIEAVDSAVTDAVRRQLVSDVPVGAFLSGGIDSPLVVAKMQEAGHSSIRAYTIATDEPATDESADASMYAAELGVEHLVESITPERALSLLADVVSASSEPFGDYSIFPTMLVSRFASKEFKVMLSGDGGDELFWGYPERSGSLIHYASNFRRPSPVNWYRVRHTCLKQGWLRKVFPAIDNPPNTFQGYRYHGSDPDEVAQWLRQNEFKYHLTMVLLKVDRASMHYSQEVRVPLLDKAVIETAAQVDWKSCLSIDQKVGKLPLRRALSRYVSQQTQRKKGFEAPMSDWLRGPLRDKFENLVMSRDNFLGQPVDRLALRQLYDRHLSGNEDHGFGLWPLLSLALWQDYHFND